MTHDLDAFFDFLCTRRVDEIVSTERILAAVDAGFTAPRVSAFWARFVAPVRTRVLARLAAGDGLVATWVPEDVRHAIADLVARPVPIPRAWVERLLGSPRVRAELKQLLEDALRELTGDLLSAAPGSKGVLGVLGWGAKTAFGGVGAELGRRLEERIGAVVDAALDRVERRMAAKLSSPRTAERFAAARRRLLPELWAQRERDVAKLAAALPWQELEALIPPTVVHNLARAAFRDLLRDEVAALLQDLASQPIGELLDELGWRDTARELVRAQAPLLAAFAAWQAGAGAR